MLRSPHGPLTATGAPQKFAIVYRSPGAVDESSIGPNDIRLVRRSDGLARSPQFVGIALAPNTASLKIGLYKLGGLNTTGLTVSDNGVYDIHVISKQVFDTDGFPAEARIIGQLVIDIA